MFVDSTANSTPIGWPADTLAPPNGPPVYLPPVPSNDSVKAGYGFQDAGQLYENDQYFIHYDLTGSTTYVTDINGTVVQHIEYSPLGETFVEEHTGSFETPYLFHAKERDDETGYYSYGARNYDPMLSQWLTVQDALGDDYPLDESGYGFIWDTDDDDNGAQSSPYMGPGVSVGDVVNPADNVRAGRGKTADARDIKAQMKMSKGRLTGPLGRRWQKLFARYDPRFRLYRQNALLPQYVMAARASFSFIESESESDDRGSISSIEESISRQSSSSFADRRGSVNYYAGRHSISSVFNDSQRNLRRISSIRRRNSSITSPLIIHTTRPRSGSISQGGNGSK